MSELESQQQGSQKFAEQVKIDNPTKALDEGVAKLAKVGGFGLIEATVDGSQNLNPDRKARKKIFLTDSAQKTERANLKKSLELWLSAITESESVPDMIEKCQKKSESASSTLKNNQKKALEATRALEAAWRSLHLFYKNTEETKLKNVSILNASPDQLKDLDNPMFHDAVQEELSRNYDRLDLRNNYSMLVMPGYLGNNAVLEKWGKTCFKNKVMLMTDFENLDKEDDIIEMFEAANHTGGEEWKSRVMMATNWLVGRGKAEEVGEEEDLTVAPSSALAGRIYSTLMSQVTAGKKHGGLNEVTGTVIGNLKKSDITTMEKMGLIPMVNEYGKVMAFSAKTLFNGDDQGMQTYSVMRVFDFVMKTLMDFLNRRAFENWSPTLKKELQEQIEKFLDKITGPGKLIEKFKIQHFDRDPNDKSKINFMLHMTPYFPAKNFVIDLKGTKGDEAESSVSWDANVGQQK
ncbi:MAG: type VI secretion system contractile sheath protein TssC [Crocinitomicaceae bacterium]|nr:type VI secretion system contractile sheath protein TssC [Crocinitomicaceae bacterium]